MKGRSCPALRHASACSGRAGKARPSKSQNETAFRVGMLFCEVGTYVRTCRTERKRRIRNLTSPFMLRPFASALHFLRMHRSVRQYRAHIRVFNRASVRRCRWLCVASMPTQVSGIRVCHICSTNVGFMHSCCSRSKVRINQCLCGRLWFFHEDDFRSRH